MLPCQRHTCQLHDLKTQVCVVNLLAAIFGDRGIKGIREKGEQGIEGFREKDEWNTGIKNCVQQP